MRTTRTIEITNGSDTRYVETIRRLDGTYWLHDSEDVNHDSLEQLQDDSDESVADAIRDNGFEIVDAGDTDQLVCGCQIQYDNSGVGHNWRNIAADEINADVRECIKGEILDGHVIECDDWTGPDGQHYRWTEAW